ncbi:glycosyltransferase family 1 protein [Mesorhizobium sp. M1399]|uniref:glycosyltransferase family 4 protein n=1 Tax=Mesorhizobium sp. M1399 TaxID=2957096 RepID=UPI003338A815
MRIGIDASNIRRGGGVTHLVEILRAADPQRLGISDVVVWANREVLQQIEDRSWLTKRHHRYLEKSLAFRASWQRYLLRHDAISQGCDLLFFPGGTNSSGFRPAVVMSQNLLPFELRELRRYGFSSLTVKLLLLRATQSTSFRNASGVVLLSRYAKQVIERAMGRGFKRCSVIPHGINSRFLMAPRRQRPQSEFTSTEPCRVVYVSIVDQYKHQWHVVTAVAELRRMGYCVELELIGPYYLPALKRLQKSITKQSAKDFVHYRGAVDYAELHTRYRSADINIFASSCENMPNILLEGMAAGLPIACSNRGPMPEVLGEGGVYFDPEDPGDIRRALSLLIESAELRSRKSEISFKRASQFSWQKTADDTFAYLAEIARQECESSEGMARHKPA